jgi:hypothetical protein
VFLPGANTLLELIDVFLERVDAPQLFMKVEDY